MTADAGAALPAVERGTGRTIVLLHGYPLNHDIWARQLETLSTDHRVVALDLPGYGLAADQPVPDTLSGFAETVHRELARRFPDPVVLAGHSFGGYIVLELMRTHPEVAEALLLANTRSGADPPEVREKRLETVRQVEDPERGLDVDATAKGLVAPAEWTSNGPAAQAAREIVRRAPRAAVVGSLKAMARRPDLTPVLGEIGVPTLVVWGEADQLIPTDQTRSMVARIPSSRGVGIAGAGHLPCLERPDEFNAATTELLGRLGDAAAS
jgi:pimeloyl-ACP methyl ester carboxylesterase